MSYYDHAVMMQLKLGQWSDNPQTPHHGHRIPGRKSNSSAHRRGIASLFILAVGLAALGVTGFGV